MDSELFVNFSYAGSVCSGKLFEEGYISYEDQKHMSITEFIEYVTKDSELTNFYMDRVFFEGKFGSTYNSVGPWKFSDSVGPCELCDYGYLENYKNDDSDRLKYIYSILKDGHLSSVREHIKVTRRSNQEHEDYENYTKGRELKKVGEIFQYLGETFKNIGNNLESMKDKKKVQIFNGIMEILSKYMK